MQVLDVTPEIIGNLIGEVAPLVEFTARWKLDLQPLRYRVLPKNRGYEEIVLARVAGAGIPIDIEQKHGAAELLMEYMLENNILGAFEPSTREILVIRENVDESNLDGLRLILAHELVHFGQYCYHRELFDQIDQAVRTAYSLAETNIGVFEMVDGIQREILAKVQPVMTIIESHAEYITQTIRRLYLPHGVIESHFSLPQVLFRLVGAEKIGQYTGGVDAVATAYRAGRIDDLFQALVN